jgi:uncharacterized protein YndB with AHSA1/START domain
VSSRTKSSFGLERTVVIHATPQTVFRYFTDSERWARWWGKSSTIDATAGGRVYIRHPDGTEAAGEVLELEPPRRIVFSYGFLSGKPIPAGSSRVAIELSPERAGTMLRLTHELPDESARDEHVQGWRFQLSLFANVVSDEVNAGVAEVADAWFDVWAESDAGRRETMLAAIATPEVRFQDRFSNLEGVSDVLAHIAATHRFMPGMRLRRNGGVRHCQGMALCDWIASGPDGAERGRGTNAFVLGPTGRIEWVTGFWS